MAFDSKELMFGLVLEEEKDDKDQYVVLRLAGGQGDAKVYVSCGETQNWEKTRKPAKNQDCKICKLGKDGGIETSAEGLGSLRAALQEMLEYLDSAEDAVKKLKQADAEKPPETPRGDDEKY